MSITVHPQFKDSPRGDLLAQAKTEPIPLRIQPHHQFHDFAIKWQDGGDKSAHLNPTGELRDFVSMQKARESFAARSMTAQQVLREIQGPGLVVANLGVSTAITCEPFGPGNGRYLGVVSQQRSDFHGAPSAGYGSSVPKTNKLLSGYVNWFDLIRDENHSLAGSALSRALTNELAEGEALPWQRVEQQGVELGQILQGIVRDVLPRSVGRELIVEEKNSLLTQGACSLVPGKDHNNDFTRIGDHFSGLFDIHPDKSYTVSPTTPCDRIKLPGVGSWTPVVVDGNAYDVGLTYYTGLGALQVVVQLELKLPQDLHGLSIAHCEYRALSKEQAKEYDTSPQSGLEEVLDPQGFRWIPIDEESQQPKYHEGLFLFLNGEMVRCDIDPQQELLSEVFVQGGPAGIVESPYTTFQDVNP